QRSDASARADSPSIRQPGGTMKRTTIICASVMALVATMLLPGVASADIYEGTVLTQVSSMGINSIWLIVAACLVMFMQAGFAFLEIGFSRGKNAGTLRAKMLTHFSRAARVSWGTGVGR